MAKCIVCGEETGNGSTCGVCGVPTELPSFFNKEEYEQWVQEYLTPQRELWRAKKEAQRQAEALTLQAGARTMGTLDKSLFYRLVNYQRKNTMYSRKHYIHEIFILNQLDYAPTRFVDLSEEQNRSVLGWTKRGILYLAGLGRIKLPHDCKKLFEDFTNLTRIVGLCYLDASAVTDMSWMFRKCSSLTTLDVSSWDTSMVADMEGMFSRCSALTTLDVSRWDTSRVTDMHWMFYDCSSLTMLDVSRWDTSRVTDMHWMFYDCSSLTTLDVSRWDTSRVTDMNLMFKNCSSLTTLDVSRWDTSAVMDMSGMFSQCSALTALDVSQWDTSKVNNMSEMFENCTNLRELNAKGWNTQRAKKHTYMFKYIKVRQNPGIQPPIFS